MRAIQIDAYGDASQLQLKEDAPIPLCGDEDLLVSLVAAGVNPVDWKMRSGAMAQMLNRPFPITLGWDGAGVVIAVGRKVTQFKAGDEVFFYAEFARGGCYAQFVAVAASQAARKPSSLSFATAAAMPTPCQAAWTALIEIAQLQAGQQVLIHGGAGAVGSAAIQLARWRGAHVSTTATAAGLDWVRSLGAQTVIDYREQKFQELVREMDVVLDTLGGATQEASWATLKRGGLLISTTEPPSQERAASLGLQARFVFTQGRGEVLQSLADLAGSGQLRVQIGQEFALADAALAHRLGESGKAKGKMVLHIDPPRP